MIGEMKTNIVIRLSRSQQMALADILVHYALLKDEPQSFVDLVEDHITTTGELLTLVTALREVELT
jgi:hypothetical protein